MLPTVEGLLLHFIPYFFSVVIHFKGKEKDFSDMTNLESLFLCMHFMQSTVLLGILLYHQNTTMFLLQIHLVCSDVSLKHNQVAYSTLLQLNS